MPELVSLRSPDTCVASRCSPLTAVSSRPVPTLAEECTFAREMDLKTLRLASLQLSPERLDAFVTYQRTMLAELASAAAGDWSGRYAFAHAKALTASKLDLVEYGKLKALVADFCGRRSTYLQVKARIESGSLEGEKLARAQKELPKLDDVHDFEAR